MKGSIVSKSRAQQLNPAILAGILLWSVGCQLCSPKIYNLQPWNPEALQPETGFLNHTKEEIFQASLMADFSNCTNYKLRGSTTSWAAVVGNGQALPSATIVGAILSRCMTYGTDITTSFSLITHFPFYLTLHKSMCNSSRKPHACILC